MSSAPKPRPRYYDLNLAHLPPPGLVSIFHRISGFLLFFPVVPALLYLMQATLGSQEGYAHWRTFFAQPEVKESNTWAYTRPDLPKPPPAIEGVELKPVSAVLPLGGTQRATATVIYAAQ